MKAENGACACAFLVHLTAQAGGNGEIRATQKGRMQQKEGTKVLLDDAQAKFVQKYLFIYRVVLK